MHLPLHPSSLPMSLWTLSKLCAPQDKPAIAPSSTPSKPIRCLVEASAHFALSVTHARSFDEITSKGRSGRLRIIWQWQGCMQQALAIQVCWSHNAQMIISTKTDLAAVVSQHSGEVTLISDIGHTNQQIRN